MMKSGPCSVFQRIDTYGERARWISPAWRKSWGRPGAARLDIAMRQRIRPNFRLAILAAGALLSSSTVSMAVTMEGLWARSDGLLRARVARCGHKFCATNVWAKDPLGDDRVGDRIIATLSPSGPDRWTGSGFDVRRKLTFDLDVSGGADKLTTRACSSGFCRSAEWTRN
jgi:uncharacterized protein (DUF2147 family)